MYTEQLTDHNKTENFLEAIIPNTDKDPGYIKNNTEKSGVLFWFL